MKEGSCALSDPDTHLLCGGLEVARMLVEIPNLKGNPDDPVQTIPICKKHYDIIKADTTRRLSISSDHAVSIVARDAAQRRG